MTILWLFTNTNSDGKAQLLADRLSKGISAPIQVHAIEPYPKIGGHKIRASFEVTGVTWPEIVLATIQRAQEMGRGWSILGDILQELELISKESNISGIEMIQIQRSRV